MNDVEEVKRNRVKGNARNDDDDDGVKRRTKGNGRGLLFAPLATLMPDAAVLPLFLLLLFAAWPGAEKSCAQMSWPFFCFGYGCGEEGKQPFWAVFIAIGLAVDGGRKVEEEENWKKGRLFAAFAYDALFV
jgi:hypothetical protein